MTSVFADRKAEIFTEYEATIRFRDKLLAGVPKNPKLIEGWIKKNTGIEDSWERRQMLMRTLTELGVEVQENMTDEALEEAIAQVADRMDTCGFKKNSAGLYIEARQIKAAIKESVNILYAGEKWGKTKKGPKNFTAERVFVSPDHVLLGVDEPVGVHLNIGHITGPKGPQATLGYHEYVEQAEATFRVKVLRDEIESEWWASIWSHAEENGLGAVRSQGYGTFDVIAWKRVD